MLDEGFFVFACIDHVLVDKWSYKYYNIDKRNTI